MSNNASSYLMSNAASCSSLVSISVTSFTLAFGGPLLHHSFNAARFSTVPSA